MQTDVEGKSQQVQRAFYCQAKCPAYFEHDSSSSRGEAKAWKYPFILIILSISSSLLKFSNRPSMRFEQHFKFDVHNEDTYFRFAPQVSIPSLPLYLGDNSVLPKEKTPPPLVSYVENSSAHGKRS